MAAVAIVTTPFFTAVIIAARHGLLTTQVARLAACLVARAARAARTVARLAARVAQAARWLGGLGGSVAQWLEQHEWLEWLHGVVGKRA